jgi:chemotaxis protein MotB
MRRRRRVQESAHADRWLISYADFITLLFAFFVTLYSISTVDAMKMQKAVTAFQVAFSDGPQRGRALVAPAVPARIAPVPIAPPARHDEALLTQVRARLEKRLQILGENRVDLTMDQRGLVVSVKEAGSFPTGRAELDNEGRSLFHEIALALVDIPNAVRVEGHTDNVPIHTARYASNWDLSTARATSVVAYFVQAVGLAPDRLSAAGYAEFHPREPNQTGAQRSRNRRVDIVILNSRTQTEEEPGERARADR